MVLEDRRARVKFALAGVFFCSGASAAILLTSLVYAATHHEAMTPILQHAARLAFMISGFMVAIMVVLAFVSWQL